MPRGIDPGFGHNVGMVDPVQQARDTLNQKITTAPESVAPAQRHAGVTGLSPLCPRGFSQGNMNRIEENCPRCEDGFP